MNREFEVGHRVIVANSEPELNGYYGHVTNVHNDRKPYPMVDVLFRGRVARPFIAEDVGSVPYPMFPHELKHVD